MTGTRTADRLERERVKLARLRSQVDAINARDENRHWTQTDSATGSGIRRKADHKGDAQRFDRYSREAALFLEFYTQTGVVQVLEMRLADEERERERHHYTRDELMGAIAIRNRYGWHKVARVNKTTVSVETGYSWTDRIAFADVLEVRQKPRT